MEWAHVCLLCGKYRFSRSPPWGSLFEMGNRTIGKKSILKWRGKKSNSKRKGRKSYALGVCVSSGNSNRLIYQGGDSGTLDLLFS